MTIPTPTVDPTPDDDPDVVTVDLGPGTTDPDGTRRPPAPVTAATPEVPAG